MLTGRLLDQVLARGWPTITPRDPGQRGGTVAIDVPEAERISRQLLERNFVIDYRPGAGVRVSPHFYNTEEECDSIIAEIESLSAR